MPTPHFLGEPAPPTRVPSVDVCPGAKQNTEPRWIPVRFCLYFLFFAIYTPISHPAYPTNIQPLTDTEFKEWSKLAQERSNWRKSTYAKAESPPSCLHWSANSSFHHPLEYTSQPIELVVVAQFWNCCAVSAASFILPRESYYCYSHYHYYCCYEVDQRYEWRWAGPRYWVEIKSW